MTVFDKKLQANRQNAQRSTGPRTPEGKAAVSRSCSLKTEPSSTSSTPSWQPWFSRDQDERIALNPAEKICRNKPNFPRICGYPIPHFAGIDPPHRWLCSQQKPRRPQSPSPGRPAYWLLTPVYWLLHQLTPPPSARYYNVYFAASTLPQWYRSRWLRQPPCVTLGSGESPNEN